MNTGNRWDNPETDELIEVLLMLKNSNEAKKFLRDLMTEQELMELGKRWKAARMLEEHIPYSEIEAKTGLSSATIARISKWLHEGMGGYSILLKRFAHSRDNSSQMES